MFSLINTAKQGLNVPLLIRGTRNASRGPKRYAFAAKKGKSLSPNVAYAKLKSSQRRNLAKGSNNTTATLNNGDFAQLHEVDGKQRSMHKNLLEKVDTFEALKIDHDVRDAISNGVLAHLKIKKPTPIQVLSTKMIQGKRANNNKLHTWLMAAETGSGKTLAYLAPLLSKLKEEEHDPALWATLKDSPGARSVILVPSMELVSQVALVVKSLCSISKFSFLATTPKVSNSTIASKLSGSRLDIFITTPEKFVKIFTDTSLGKQQLSKCRFVVADEADSLMDDSFGPSTLKAIGLCTNITDLVFCSATIPRKFDKVMREVYPEAQRIVTPGIHKMPSHVDFRVVEVFRPPYQDNKQLALLQALYAIYHDNTEKDLVKRVIVFVNSRNDVEGIAQAIRDSGYDAFGINGRVDVNAREAAIRAFVTEAKELKQEAGAAKVSVLVTTDLLARGVDMRNIRNVILYDMPNSSVDLLHRSGRTGRLGKRGRVFLFITKKDSKGWIRGLQKAVNQGLSLA